MPLMPGEYYCIWCHEPYLPRESKSSDPVYFCSKKCQKDYTFFVKETAETENNGGPYGPN